MMKSAGKKSCEVKGEQAPRKRVFLAGSRPYCRKGREFLMNEERFTHFFLHFPPSSADCRPFSALFGCGGAFFREGCCFLSPCAVCSGSLANGVFYVVKENFQRGENSIT